MKQLVIIILLATSTITFGQTSDTSNRKLFIYGGEVTKEFIKHTAQLTGKQKPKICFMPTAAADNVYYINYWYELCSELEVEPHVLEVWINSPNQKESWEEILTKMDAIIVGGGNTLNMIAIWRAQEIDLALRKAYDQGVVLAGGSAGSLCWFDSGTTDSRPKDLTLIEGLGFLKFSHCPHYNSEESRRPLYHANILTGKLGNGYACDDKAGILFINGKLSNGVSIDNDSHSYYVFKKNGEIVEEEIESKIIK